MRCNFAEIVDKMNLLFMCLKMFVAIVDILFHGEILETNISQMFLELC